MPIKPQISILNSFLCGLVTTVISAWIFGSNQWFLFVASAPILHTVIAFKMEASDKVVLMNIGVVINLALTALTLGLAPAVLINSPVAMIAYYVMCHGFIFKTHNINKGILYSAIFGIVSGIPALLSIVVNDRQLSAILISSVYVFYGKPYLRLQ